MDQAQALGELIGLIRRRLLMLVLILGAGTAAAVWVAFKLPSTYETSAKILIESQQIPDELARSTVNLSTEARLQLIQQRLMARDSMVALIEKLGLFADLRHLAMTKQVEMLRAATRIESISATVGNPWSNSEDLVAFTITVTLNNAEQAARVANELADSAIAQNLQVRADRARDTLAYFEQEERRVASELAAAEAELSDFKKANEGALPEDLDPSRAALVRLQTADIDIDRQLLELDLRRADLEATLSGAAPAGAGELSRSQSELQRLELELATRRRVLAPNHPELRQLRQELEAVRALVTSGAADDAGGQGDGGFLAQRSASIRQQIEQLSAQIDQLNRRKSTLRDQRLGLEAASLRNPEVEASLNALERRLEQLRERYTDVARRHAEASTGAQLEANQQSERFEVLERALVPASPVGPNRKKLIVFGVGASAGAAFGLVFLLEMLRPSMRTSAQVERQLGIRPVVSIPYVSSPGEAMRRRALYLVGLVLILAGAWFGAPLVDRYIVPLESLKTMVQDRLGRGAIPDGSPGSG